MKQHTLFNTSQAIQKSWIYRVWMEGSEGKNGKQEPIMKACNINSAKKIGLYPPVGNH